MRLMINGLLHTWLWWQTNACSAVLETNTNILLIWNSFYTLYVHLFLNMVPVIDYWLIYISFLSLALIHL